MSIKSKPTFGRKVLLSTVGTAMLYIPIQQSFAQLEEIIVTSRRYEESISDVPLAVAVMDASYLSDTRVNSIQDILELTPGADWGQFTKAQPQLSMRGIAAGAFGNASLEHAVSIVYDGMPIPKAFMMTLPAFDLQRVEVLRGPQGTTFGRNATLGMMHFISARPSQETSGAVEASIGERDLFGVNGFYNTALSDTLSGRIAFNYDDRAGAIEDETTGDRLEYAKNTSVRASLLYEPSDTFTAYLKLEHIDDDEFPTARRGVDQGVQWLNPNYGSYVSNTSPWKATLSPAPAGGWKSTRQMTIATGELTWALGNDVSVTSITGYADGEHYTNSDAFGTPYDIRDQEVTNDGYIFTQEVRLDNHASGNRLRWLAGAAFLKDEEHRIERNESEPLRGNCTSNPATRVSCPRNSTLFTDATNKTDAYGIFGEVTFDVSEQLTLAVGGRYSDDKRSLDFETYGYGAAGGLGGIGLGNPDSSRDCSVVIANGQCGTPANPVGFDDITEDSWDNFSKKVSLMYALNDNNNIYALYSEGFKAGGFQQDARTNSNLDVHVDSENATNYEIGWKGNYDNIVFAVTAFKQEQTDVQTGNLVVVGTSQANLLVNAAGVENTGFEFEATWAPTDNLTIGGSVAVYDPKFLEGSKIAATFDVSTGSFAGGEDVSGTIPANSVDQAAYMFATYNWGLANGSTLSLRGDWRHRGTVQGQNGVRERNGLNLLGTGIATEKPELNKLGLRLSWTSADDKLDVSLWGRNLDNKPDYINFGPGFGYVYLNGPGPNPVRARPSGTTGRRQIGATVRYNFGG